MSLVLFLDGVNNTHCCLHALAFAWYDMTIVGACSSDGTSAVNRYHNSHQQTVGSCRTSSASLETSLEKLAFVPQRREQVGVLNPDRMHQK